MHTHVVESPLQVRDAKVQQQKTVYTVRHPRFLFGSSTNMMASCHHCRPSKLAHILFFA